MSEILSLKELSEYLKIPKSTLYKLSEANQMPSFKVGKQLRFRMSAINSWIEKRERTKKRGK